MSGEDETIKMVLYIVVVLIVVYIGIGFVLGFNPSEWTKKLSSVRFEPGALDAGDLSDNIELGCRQSNYLITLKDLKFDVQPGIETLGGVLDVSVALDFKNLLFLGTGEGNKEIIECKKKDGKFDCGTTTLMFDTGRQIGGLEGREVLHFTAWKSNPVLLDSMRPSGNQYTTLASTLNNYGEFYLSSFDIVIDDTQAECSKTECKRQADENSCQNTAGCYWYDGWLTDSCEFCPKSTTCSDYDSSACVKCPIPSATCTTGLLGGCSPL
jgi:hypothetical protein